MATGGTRLLAGAALDTTDLSKVQFPSTILGGYRATDVEVFRTRALRAIEELHAALAARAGNERELVAEVERLNGLLTQQQAGTAPMARMTGGHAALGVLAVAEQNAERVLAEARQHAEQLTGQARHQCDQMRAHTEMQAADIISAATEQAEAERTRIIAEASAESRRVASGFRVLAEEMGTRLHELAGQVAQHAAEWDGRAAEASAPASSPRAGNGRRAAAARPA